MKLIRNLLIGAALVLSTVLSVKAASPTYQAAVGLQASDVTENLVVISTGGLGQSITVLAANANRLDFDIEVVTCTVPTSKVFYAYDGSFTAGVPSVSTATWVNFASADPNTRRFRKPDWVMPIGAIVAITDGAATSCWAVVREWTSSSQLFR